ncbi:MAG: alginate lyase family protein [Xanthomonadales bacterium]|nr:alginate lyase family protein [Xanthomonadales bacterium]
MKNSSYTNKLLSAIFLIVLVLGTATAHEQHPNIFINSEELDAVKAKVAANAEPWKSAHNQMIAQADIAKNLPNQSVTFGGPSNCNVPVNVFCTDPFYAENPDLFDSISARAVGAAVRDLGMAYAFTGNDTYAIELVRLARVWAINPETAIQAYFVNNQARISLMSWTTGFIYGLDLAWNYPGWTANDRATLKAWVHTLGGKVRDFGTVPNNFENWRNAFLSMAGAFTGDQAYLDTSFENFRIAVGNQIKGSGAQFPGYMGQEARRNQNWGGLGYSLYAIHAMTISAEVARHHGVNLYDYEDSGQEAGAGLRLAMNYIAPYLVNQSAWAPDTGRDRFHQRSGPNPLTASAGMGVYELAHSVWGEDGDTTYLDVIDFWERPMGMNDWSFGVITLTHANRFLLGFEPTPPTIITQPVSQSAAEGSAVTFNVVASGSATLAYQWYRDGDPIGGASSASYTLDPVLAAYNGAEYHSVVSNELGDVTSSIAELTVVVDTTAPLIESAVVVSPTQVDIRFSEAVTPVSAQMPANYQFSGGIGVLAATLSADNKTVQLQTANLVVDTVYTVTISNIKDTSAAANEIAPGSTVDVVYTPVMNFDNGQWPLDWIPLNQSRWKVEADNGNNALFLYKSDYGPLSGDRLGEYIRSPDSYDDFLFQAQIRTNEGAGNPNADYAMVFGWVDEENYYYMMFNRNQSNTVLFRVVAGERRQLAAATANWLSDDEYHLVEVRRTGNNIEVRFDGNPVLDVMDATFLNGKLGLGSFNDSAYFDDIRISAGSGEVSDLVFADEFE